MTRRAAVTYERLKRAHLMDGLSITGFSIFKAGLYAAIGWYTGRALYDLAVCAFGWFIGLIGKMV